IRPLETMADYTGIMRKHMTGIESEISNIIAGDGGVLAGGVEIVVRTFRNMCVRQGWFVSVCFDTVYSEVCTLTAATRRPHP
ncbi:hypothetical protein M8C21_033856, partial [Ambrosia artemisiifolia]